MNTVGSSGDVPSEVTLLLREWSTGDASALERLIPLVYAELRRMAGRELGKVPPNSTLQPTALINELFLRFLNQRSVNWESRAHFFGTAAKIMRQILVDYVRRGGAAKRGGGVARVELSEIVDPVERLNLDIMAIHEALTKLEAQDKELAQIVELRFFAGLSNNETALVLGVSPITVKRRWALAKAWLMLRMTRS